MTCAEDGRVRVDGKQFSCHGDRFHFRGITYGTFARREDGACYPEDPQLETDLANMAASGFTVVRTYTPPTESMVKVAGENDLKLLAGAFWPDWRYLVGASRREERQLGRDARDVVRQVARRLAGRSEVAAICLANEIPADVVRWVGGEKVARLVDDLASVVREEDAAQLVTYANYPSTEYLPLDGMDFLMFNVFLEHQEKFRAYLTRLHHLAGARPLVIGEMGLDSESTVSGERRQAEVLDWQMQTTLERGVAGTCVFSWTDDWAVGDQAVDSWHFGLTRADRSAKPALEVAKIWNNRTVRDLEVDWPTVSVVICGYDAEATIDECLSHTCALDYPELEVIVVDDGSTDATAAIAGRYPRAQLVRIAHGGLAVARNAGYLASRGELVAYLDSDAYPTPEWPYYLALGMDDPAVAGVGGPNVPPSDDPPGAYRVAQAPGGPVHVLLSDDRAEHIPGCNMAFWRDVLVEADGFDSIYTAAGDDVDFCWRVLDLGWEIAFHPAALVWHHRRPSVAAYLRQQRGYGRAEALVEMRHPDRFTFSGSARWRGRIYSSSAPIGGLQRVYRGQFGSAAYQSVYRGGGHALDLVHQIGVPAAIVMVATAPLGVIRPEALIPALVASVTLLLLMAIDVARIRPPARHQRGFRLHVAGLHLVQPLARHWGRWSHREPARLSLGFVGDLPGPVQRLGRGTLLLPLDRPRAELTATVVTALRCAGLRARPQTGWEDHDATFLGSALVTARLVTSGHPDGCVQLRVRRHLATARVVVVAVVALAAGLLRWPIGVAIAAAALADVAWGMWRSGPFLRRVVRDAST